MTTTLDEAIRLTVDYITNRAQHYFSIVRAKNEEGVLWFSFSYRDDVVAASLRSKRFLTADEAARQGVVTVKRTAFLPLTAIVSGDAKPLIEMTNRCDRRQQFVAWFTLEVEGGGSHPQVSKVIVVDTLFASVPTTSANSRSLGATTPSRFTGGGGSRATTPNRSRPQQQHHQQHHDGSESAIDDLRRDMQETAAHLRHNHAAHGNMSTLGGDRSYSRDQSNNSPPQQRRQTVEFADEDYNYNNSNNNASNYNNNNMSSASATPSDANYSHLLKVSLQISDSVAKLGARVDDMFSQFSKFEEHINKQMYDLKMKVQRVDSDVQTVAPKMREVVDSTAHFGVKLAHLRQETQAMFEGVSKRVNAVSDSVIARNLSGATHQQQQQYQQHQQSSSNSFSPSGSFAGARSSSGDASSRHYSAAVAEAEKVNFDDLIARHSSVDNNANNNNNSRSNVSFVGEDNHHRHSSADRTAAAAGVRSPNRGAQDALDRFLDDSSSGGASYETLKKNVAMKNMTEFNAQGIVDDFNTVARDLRTGDGNNSNSSASPAQNNNNDSGISVASVHRQKASLELARQSAANRSEAQAIASNYMNERNRAMGASTTDMRNGVPQEGVPVPLEVSSSSVGGGPVVVSDSHQGPMFAAHSGGGMSASSSPGAGGRRSESLSDMIASMERRLQ